MLLWKISFTRTAPEVTKENKIRASAFYMSSHSGSENPTDNRESHEKLKEGTV